MAKNENTKEANEMVEIETNALVAGSMFEEDAGGGLEGADKSSFAIPFLTMLQGLSPQCETIDGAKPGLMINTITNELFTEVLVIPSAYQRRFVRWSPRSSGGGFKGEYNPIDVETNNIPGMRLINGTYFMDVPEGANPFDAQGRPLYDHLADTRNHFVLMQAATGAWQPALIALGSTQITKSKRWMSRIQGIEFEGKNGKFNPPSYSHIYKIKGAKQENAKGSWWGFDIDLHRALDPSNERDLQLYAIAKTFNKSVTAGAIEVQHINPDEAGAGSSNSGEVNKF